MEKGLFRRKWENYWYYYKIHTFAGIVVVLFVGILIFQLVTRINPDLTLIVATQKTVLSTEQQADLQNVLAKYTGDVNKDGHKKVEVDLIYFSDPTTMQAMQEKLMVDLSMDDQILYLTDDPTYQAVLNSSDKNIFQKVTDALPDRKLTDAYRLPISDTALKNLAYAGNLSGLSFSTRLYGSNLNNKKKAPNIENALNTLRKLAVS